MCVCVCVCVCVLSCLVVSDSLQPLDRRLPGSSVHEIFQAKILEQVANSLLQGIFLTQGLNLHLLHWEMDSLPLSHLGSLL